jgi:hypothetical protein
MRGIPVLESQDAFRVRRWDAVILGSALPGLVAAVRLGMRGARVLVLEEDRAANAFPGLREPYLMPADGEKGVLGSCLEALGVPLIDRRGVETEPLAYQVALPGARVNIGQPDWTADELACWGLIARDEALDLVTRLDENAAAERARMLAGQMASTSGSKRGIRRALPRNPDSPASDPNAELPADAPPRLRAVFDAQVRALGDFAEQAPANGSRVRLLGGALGGATGAIGRERGLLELLRKRIEALHGEFRRLGGGFRIVSANQLPAIAADESLEICAGRALIVNAPPVALRDSDYGRAAPWLPAPDCARRRLTLHLRGRRALLPLGMASRVICVRDPSEPMQGTNVVRVRTFPGRDGTVDLTASAVVPADESEQRRHLELIGRSVVDLMPLRDEGWSRVPIAEPHWDTDTLLGDAGGGDGLKRPVSRVPAYVLDRWPGAELGFEADLLLGWKSGDAIASNLP